MRTRVSGWRAVVVALLVGTGAQMLSGCNGFFVYPGSTTTGTGGTGSSTGDYVFFSYSNSAGTYIGGYGVGSTLSAATGSPLSVIYTPQSMVVSTNNNYLFVASGTYIDSYSIGSGGALSSVSSTGSASRSLAVSPDGQWLLGIESTGGTASTTYLDVYPITGGTLGTLKQTQITSAGGGTITAQSQETIQVAPNGAFVAVALGTGGAVVIPFSTSSGTLSSTEYPIGTAGSTSGFNALAIDANSYLYLVGASNGTPAIFSYAVDSTSGVPNTTAITPAPATTVGSGPVWVTVSTNSAYVYVANSTAGTISEFSTALGVLTFVGSVTSPPSSVSALGRDSSGNYLLALGYNGASGLQPYTINSGGTLSAGTPVGSGTVVVPATIAMTH